MNFDFDYFREVIDFELLDYLDELDQATDKYYERIVFIDQEAADFGATIREAKIDLGADQQQAFVDRHQVLLIEFANELMSIMGEEGLPATGEGNDGKETRLNLCRYLFDTTVELLTGLELNFPQMFRMDVPIPDAYRVRALRQLRQLLPGLKTQLTEKGLGSPLLAIATEALEDFLHAGNEMLFTYGNMAYLNLLARELQKAAMPAEDAQQPVKGFDEAMFDRLRLLNLNSVAFRDHIIGQYRTDLDGLFNYADKQLWLIRKLKDWKQVIPIDESLRPGYPTIKEAVMDWLTTEQQSIQEELQVIAQMPKEDSGKQKESEREEEDEEIYEGYKLPVKLTDGQLAFLVRLLVEIGIISEPVKEKIYRFFAKYFITVRDKDTTGSTFKKRYNDPSLPAKMAVRGFLEKMWRSI